MRRLQTMLLLLLVEGTSAGMGMAIITGHLTLSWVFTALMIIAGAAMLARADGEI